MLGSSEADHFDKILTRTLMMLLIVHHVNINKTVFKQCKKRMLNTLWDL